MKRHRLTVGIALLCIAMTVIGFAPQLAAQAKVIKIGLSLPLTGADADGADAILKGAQMAIAEINAKGGAGGYKLEAVVFDSATPAAGQYDPAQAATNYKKFVADNLVLAAVGPVMSGEGKAISPILSEADMATITPSSTNPDITDPKFQAQYRPKGKAVYFRTVTTDAFQGPNMANYLVQQQKVKSVYILDDGGAFGVGIADSFQRRAQELGVKIFGRDRLDPKEADYKTILTKIKGMNPDALYYGGVYDLSWPKQSGKEAVEGWFCSQASPELVTSPKLEAWVTRFKKEMKRDPTNYAITAYDAVYVIADSIERTVKDGKPVNRSNLRDAIQAAKLSSLQGPIAFDPNGDILTRTVSIYQWRDGEIKYVAVAPEK